MSDQLSRIEKDYDDADRRQCPQCEEGYLEDDDDGGVTCAECEYSIGPPDPMDDIDRDEDRDDDVW